MSVLPPARTRPSTGTDGRRRTKPAAASSPSPTMRENVRFWIKAIVIILLLRAFIFEPFRIPSASMENTLLVGDFLIVSKLHYGARTPSTVGVPFTSIYLPGLEFPQTRLPGFSAPERGDVAVFNYPSSVDVERGTIAEGVPVERRAPYIKRLVAVPGDTLAVLDKVLHIDGRPVPLAPTQKQRWRVTAAGPSLPPPAALDALGVDVLGPAAIGATGVPEAYIAATTAQARALDARPDVASVVPFVLPEGAPQGMVYPQDSGWNADQFGPVVVPGRGMTVALNGASWPVYAEVIARYEGHTASVGPAGEFLVDGHAATSYTFEQDYFFAMGDSRDNSVDSRFWGFVPESHLVGKAVFTFLSFKGDFPFVRPERFFRAIP